MVLWLCLLEFSYSELSLLLEGNSGVFVVFRVIWVNISDRLLLVKVVRVWKVF